MTRYPEHEKLKAIQAESEACGAFLDWMSAQGYHICKLRDKDERFIPVSYRTEELLAKHFDIDEKKLEQEKRKILSDFVDR